MKILNFGHGADIKESKKKDLLLVVDSYICQILGNQGSRTHGHLTQGSLMWISEFSEIKAWKGTAKKNLGLDQK